MNRQHSTISKIRAKAKAVYGAIQFEGDLNHMAVYEYDGSPNGALTAPLFALCYDYTNNDVYINTDGSTTWVKIID